MSESTSKAAAGSGNSGTTCTHRQDALRFECRGSFSQRLCDESRTFERNCLTSLMLGLSTFWSPKNGKIIASGLWVHLKRSEVPAPVNSRRKHVLPGVIKA